jgi:hypothetical protein
VALVDAPQASAYVRALADALRAAGREAAVVRVPRRREELLRRRGFTGPLTHVPGLALALRRGGHHVVHAFTAPDALAARWSGPPVVFTCVEALGRETVADRRLRLALLRAAVEDSAAVTAADEAAAEGLRRWMAVDAPVVPAGDAAGWERVYAPLLARGGAARAAAAQEAGGAGGCP